MNLSIPDITILGVGVILVFAGVKNLNPVTVVKNILSGKPLDPGKAQPLTPGQPPTEPFIHVIPSSYTPPTSI